MELPPGGEKRKTERKSLEQERRESKLRMKERGKGGYGVSENDTDENLERTRHSI